jgi:hypothetical protein
VLASAHTHGNYWHGYLNLADDPSYKDWARQWEALQNWVFPQR